MQTRIVEILRTTLEAAGIIFIAADDTAGPGLRLRLRLRLRKEG